MKILYAEHDISRDLARGAFNGTSMNPERRGDGVIASYIVHMEEVETEFSKWATEDNQKEMANDLEAYRARYVGLLKTYLHSHSNIVSAFIVGPSGFPARQMEKRNRWCDNHRDRWLEFSKKRLDQLRRKYDPRRIARAPISSDDADAVSKLQAKIDKAERLQELMKAANKVVRKKKLTDEDKQAALVELGLTEKQAYELLVPDYMGKIGFASYQLSNNNANIRRMKERIAHIERQAQDETTVTEIGRVVVVDNVEENRVQIMFPDKPSAEIRKRLKSNGFNWAPSWLGRPWQRKRNDYALQLAKEIASEYEEV